MSSRLDLPDHQGSASWAASRRILVEDYLDHLCAPLVGLVPYPERQSLRLEVEGHLLALIEEYEADGLHAEAATAAALREHGEPWPIGQAFLDEWCRREPESRLARYAATATLRAFACFGVVTVPMLLLVEWYTLFLKDPERSLLRPVLVLLALLGPVLAGSLTGIMIPAGASRAACKALAILLLASFGVGLLLLPDTEGLRLFLFQLLFWLPAGLLSTALAGFLARSSRRQRFLRLVRRAPR